jgi:hypothetical protein
MIVVIAANRTSAKVTIMKEPTNNTSQSENEHEESTYALLMRSEEKSRNLLEMVIYPLLTVGAIIAIWQFVLKAVELPSTDTKAALRITSTSALHSRPEDRHRGI